MISGGDRKRLLAEPMVEVPAAHETRDGQRPSGVLLGPATLAAVEPAPALAPLTRVST
jgi:hypothetical protein